MQALPPVSPPMQPVDPLEEPTGPDDRAEVMANFRVVLRLRFMIFPMVLALIFLASLVGLARQDFLDVRTLFLHGVNAAVVLGLNILALVLVRRVREIGPLVLFQLAIDALNFTFTIYKTGGAASPMSFLYLGVVFAASLLAGTRATWGMAGLCAVLYGAVVGLEAAGILPHQAYFLPLEGRLSPDYLALVLPFTALSLALMAFLATALARELRKRQRALRQVNRELDHRVRTLLLLHRTTEALNRFRTVPDIADYVLGEMLTFLELDRALLYLARGRSLALAMVKHRPGLPDDARGALRVTIPLREDAGLTAQVAISRLPCNVRRPEEDPRINRELARKIGMNPFALLPLVVRNRLVGVLGVDRSLSFGEISDQEFQLLQVYANQAAIAISALRRA